MRPQRVGPLPEIYSEAEISRLKDDKSLQEDQLIRILEYLDPDLKYDKILETGLLCGWYEKKKNEMIGEYMDQVHIDLNKLKEDKEISDLFHSDTILWVHNFYFQWRLRHQKCCELKFSDRSAPKRSLSSIRGEDISRYIHLHGRVKRVSGLNVSIVSTYYQCNYCRSQFPRDRLWYQKLKEQRCPCGNKALPLVEKEALRRYETWQTITIQDTEEQEESASGSMLDCRILEARDFFKVLPGETVKLKGVLRSEVTEKAKSKLYLDIYSIETVVSKKPLTFTTKKIEKFKALSREHTLWEDLKREVFPQLLGLEFIKEAALLQYIGGASVASRNTIHVLVAGDAGVGKSQILKCIQNALGGHYSTGLGSSVAGLTATVYKDAENQWNLDGGTVVLASGSTVLLDECDKLSVPVANALLEPMEQQTVSISKAGINVSLPARTKIFAVSNPRLSQKFDLSGKTSLREQIGFSPPFLSRFDLIFLITERSQKREQEEMASLVLNPQLRRKPNIEYLEYLRYAKTISPTFPEEVKLELVKFYNTLKTKYDSQLSLGPRCIEGIARLTEARAKGRLSEVVTLEDLEYVKLMYLYSLKTQGVSEESSSILLPQLIGVPLSRSENFVKYLIDFLRERPLTPKELFMKTVEVHPIVSQIEFQKAISRLEKEGVIYKPDGVNYKLIELS